MKKILVAYATRAGSTVQVADAIAQSLTASGASVDVKPVKNVTAVDGYAAVVIGSAIRMGNWLPEAVEFAKKNQAALNRMPTAFFTVHMLNRDDSETSRQASLAYTAAARAIVTPRAEAFFAGKMDYAKLSFLDRLIAQTVAKSTHSGEGDYRDWDGIRGWAGEMSKTLGVAG
jgi:menaquinone-dependent protoporphyrinogen oxidase